MAKDKRTIQIESILGGHAPTTHFAAKDQFRASIGIDPALQSDDTGTATSTVASGLLRPVSYSPLSGTQLNNAPLWFIQNPKTTTTYVYDLSGSVYSIAATFTSITGLGDLNDGGSATGNGAAYYDNYIYFSRATTVARYGPLDGTAAFTDDYWVSTLSKTALTNTTYPWQNTLVTPYPNHVLHRHSDGKLYVADVVGNQGTIHYIQTSKATVEGDTDAGSTYNALQVGYGLWPMAMESYGDSLVIAFYEGSASLSTNNTVKPNAKIAFWDTTSQNVNSMTWVEFPDPIITSVKNINGVLYVVSGPQISQGFRISRYVGGKTFEEVLYSENGEAPFQGAIDGSSNRLIFGSYTYVPETAGAVYSYGLQKSVLGNGLFCTGRASGGAGSYITSLGLLRLPQPSNGGFVYNQPVIGWSLGSGAGNNGIDKASNNNFTTTPAVWWSQLFRLGQPFKITKIRIPLAQTMATNMTVTPKIYTDDGAGTTTTLTTINSTNFPSKRGVVLRPDNLTGDHNFWLELKWTGTALCTVNLPITIEYELLDD